MDLASILGILLCFAMFVYGVIDNAGINNIGRYLDLPSAIITFGGAFSRFWHRILLQTIWEV